MNGPHTHCHLCGSPLTGARFPKTCLRYGHPNYLNPLPVAVMLAPTTQGRLVLVRRAVEPVGLALPGGFIDANPRADGSVETWQQAAARELAEETGAEADADSVDLLDVISAPDGTVLIFGSCAPLEEERIDAAGAGTPQEISGVELLTSGEVLTRLGEIVFPIHRQVIARNIYALIG